MGQHFGDELRVCVVGYLGHFAIAHYEHPAVAIRIAPSGLGHAVVATFDDDDITLSNETLGANDVLSGELFSERGEQLGNNCTFSLVDACLARRSYR